MGNSVRLAVGLAVVGVAVGADVMGNPVELAVVLAVGADVVGDSVGLVMGADVVGSS